MKNLIIRQETKADHGAVYELVKRAFENAEHTSGDEQDLVVRLRNSKAFVPQLSLVAVLDGQIVGQILFTEIKVGNTTQLALAPISVLPEFHGLGIGGALITEGHHIAKKLGYGFSVLIGHPTYYPRFGYRNAAEFGIKDTLGVPEDVFMAVNLQGDDVMLDGTVEYAKEFFEK